MLFEILCPDNISENDNFSDLPDCILEMVGAYLPNN